MQERRLRTQCVVVGGGPGGMMLGLGLARAGVDVVVLEKHGDFLRDFRGDTVHPSTLDVIDQLGIRNAFEAIEHRRVTGLDIVLDGTRLHPIDLSRLHGPNRHVALMPQWDLLNLLADHGRTLPGFRLLMSTESTSLIRDGERTAGVVARDADGELRIEAPLTVLADGRGDRLRAEVGMNPRSFGVPIDVLWFRIDAPRAVPPDTLAYVSADAFLITIPRVGYFQCGLLIPKGGLDAVRAAGLPAFRERIVRAAPFLADTVGGLDDWDAIKLLSVQVDRLDRWWRPGLLAIGDAAHAMSPAFGVGINYAVQDAVAAANTLVAPLRAGADPAALDRALARVQRRRRLPVSLMQPLQLRAHRLIGSGRTVLHSPPRARERVAITLLLPIARRLAARIVGRGFRPERFSERIVPSERR
jgi:2-polyprenyl-6-methoxyphenol hydroxylase-like FAD-dependent oxidoreductase